MIDFDLEIQMHR